MSKILGRISMAVGVLLIACSAALAWNNSAESDRAEQKANEIVDRLLPDIESGKAEADGEYAGIIEIPSLQIKLPVAARWDYERLKSAPCVYYSSLGDRNMVIAGHNYAYHFGRLFRLKTGDSVIFTDARGVAHRYRVTELLTLPPTAVEEMTSSDFPLTLYTCTFGAARRFTVRCEEE